MAKSSLSLAVPALLAGSALLAADSLTQALQNGRLSGQARLFYIDRNYDGFVTLHRSALAVGGYMRYETDRWRGLSAGLAFYTTQNFGIDEDNLPGSGYDPTLTRRDGSGYTIVGEAYLEYAHKTTMLKLGRQRLDTPMAGSDDARMVPNLFEAYLLTNTDLPDTTLIAAHVTKMAQGTFGNVYKGGGLGATAGYTYLAPDQYDANMDVDDPTGRFLNMGRYAIGKSNDGVSLLAVKYTGIENVTLQAWDYYAWDMMNILYLQADAKWLCLLNDNVTMKASAQYIHESDVGDDLVGEVTGATGIESDYFGLKLGAAYGMLSGYVAYSSTADNDGETIGSILTTWGGMPAFTQGMVTRHQFFADTDTWKVAGTYRFDDMGVNANATLYYCSFDIGRGNPYNPGKSWTATEAGFDIKYYPEAVKNLQLRFRANFPRDFYAEHATNSPDNVDWDEYRFIVNYTF